jgi:outer membrane protein assembly factor BamB
VINLKRHPLITDDCLLKNIAPPYLIVETCAMRIILCLLAISMPLVAQKNWPQFRGPEGNGHAAATDLPLEWAEDKNVKWKAPIHGKGWSSPVVWGKQVWLTTATENGKKLSVLCLDLDSGRVLLDKKLFDVAEPQFCHKFNSYASPTPVIEAGRVYISFGSPGIACIDTKSLKVKWTRRDFVCDHFRGAGSSPILFGDLLINHHDGADLQYAFALNKTNGRTVWNTKRSVDYKDLGTDGKPKAGGDWRKAYATPHIFKINGKPVLVSSGAKAHYGYEPATGRELWRVVELGQHSAAARPIFGHDLFYISTGFSKSQIIAIRPGGKGIITKTHVAWRYARGGVPKKPSLLLIDDLIYMIGDQGGLVTCVEAKTGKEIWSERISGNYSASPLYTNGRLYFFSEEGKTTILATGREFKEIAKNKLTAGFMASPAVAGQSLFLRTKTHLYRIEK